MLKPGARITSGVGKNRKLEIPPIHDIKVPQDIVKLAMFSILGEKINGSLCLDLFAGSGSLGIEALSRGAAFCDFVDIEKSSGEAIKRNVSLLGEHYQKRAGIYVQDALKFIVNIHKTYDIIFSDPFYYQTKHKYLMEHVQNILKPDGVILFTHSKETNLDDATKNTRLVVADQRRFGATLLSIIKKSSE